MKTRGFGPGEGFASGVFKEESDDAGWLDVAVPDDVHRTLIDARRISDPFYDSDGNSKHVLCPPEGARRGGPFLEQLPRPGARRAARYLVRVGWR